MTYSVTFIYDYTILRTTVETDETDDYQIALVADEVIHDEIGFAPLAHCNDYEVELV